MHVCVRERVCVLAHICACMCVPYLHISLAGRGGVALCTSQMERAAMLQH